MPGPTYDTYDPEMYTYDPDTGYLVHSDSEGPSSSYDAETGNRVNEPDDY